MIQKLIIFFTVSAFSFLPLFSQSRDSGKADIRFSIDTRFGAEKGTFKKTSLKIKDKKKGIGTVEIDIASIDTGNGKRDDHLRNEDFFDAPKYPKAIMEILSVEINGTALKGKGKLTIKGITKDIEFAAVLAKNGETETYTGSLKLNRQEYGITYSSMMAGIKDIVTVDFTVTIP
ncbi:MAG TPA: YceI family protein [Leptospiraceae bacterium]|nr:YceI family protein [Leptospiraceae bacterium]HNF12080.1 YceI family protein [Leptospiraceae bacterium]